VVVVLLSCAVLAGAALQSATGFGFSLLSAPILFAALDPQPAIGLLAVLSMAVNLMTLLTEGRRPEPLAGETRVLILAAMPGALLGVVVLRSLDAVALQVLLSVGVIATLAVRHLGASQAEPAPLLVTDGGATVPAERLLRARPAWSAPAAGLLAGALSTSTSAAGPPLLLHLLGRGARPATVRDTLTVCFFALGLLTPIALVVTRSTEAIPDAGLIAVGLPAVVIGHLGGRRAFALLAHGHHYERVVTAVLVVSVVAGLLTVVL
jgi:hypothetical protein